MKDPPKSVLLIGLGNPLMGDEGIGWHVAERLRMDPRLPPYLESIAGGTDLLRYAPLFEKYRHVVLVDALLDENAPGHVRFVDGPLSGFDSRQGHAHSLSALQAIELLQLLTPSLSAVHITLALVGIASASIAAELSAPLAAALPGITGAILNKCAQLPETPAQPAHAPPPFQICGACKQAWPTWEDFVVDPAIRLLGFQAVIANADLNLLIFEHRCGSSVSILARRLRHLLPVQEAERPSAMLFGTSDCHGHCRFLANLEMCDSPCVNAHDRRLILMINQMRKSSLTVG